MKMEEITERLAKLDQAIAEMGIVIFYCNEPKSREWLDFIFGYDYIAPLLDRWWKYTIGQLQIMRTTLMQHRRKLKAEYFD